jgi:hypothetical protein
MNKRWSYIKGAEEPAERLSNEQGWNNLSNEQVFNYNPTCEINIHQSILILSK